MVEWCYLQNVDSVISLQTYPCDEVADLGGSKVSTEPPFLAKSKIDCYTKATVLDKVLVFMEPYRL